MAGKVKASDIVSLKKILRSRKSDVETQVIQKLSPDARDVYENASATMWIPLAMEAEILRASVDVCFAGSPQGIRELGRLLALQSMSSFYKVFLRIPSVDFIISRIPQLWSMNYDSGRVEINKTGPGSGFLKAFDFPELSAFQREEVAGYICGVLELTKAKNPQVVVQDCPDHWEWKISWE